VDLKASSLPAVPVNTTHSSDSNIMACGIVLWVWWETPTRTPQLLYKKRLTGLQAA